ncbi:hypothetical protein PAPYR_1977 [Paratrimastix pyriformis]|uniref:Uncharacterized protein n=1 Tax=Paratrimastix pyriformis TaxID=342808 RepID=A0ABQ8UQI5_9EUKA|nr:hypothetical protein PAPYR_1977 [Paratrimastix pyriformis]
MPPPKAAHLLLILLYFSLIPRSNAYVTTRDVEWDDDVFIFEEFGFLAGGSIDLTITFNRNVPILIFASTPQHVADLQELASIPSCSWLKSEADSISDHLVECSGKSCSFSMQVEKAVTYDLILANCDRAILIGNIQATFLNPGGEQLDSGQIPLPQYFIVSASVWGFLTLVWLALWACHMRSPGVTLLQKAGLAVPATRCLDGLGFALYWDMVHRTGQASTIAVAALSLLSVLQTLVRPPHGTGTGRLCSALLGLPTFLLFLMLASKGWQVTRLGVGPRERAMMLLFLTAMGLSEYFYRLIGGFFIFLVVIMYFSIMRHVFTGITYNRALLAAQLMLIEQAHMDPRPTPAYAKWRTYSLFGAVLFGYLLLLVSMLDLFLPGSVQYIKPISMDLVSLAMVIAVGAQGLMPPELRSWQWGPVPNIADKAPPLVLVEHPALPECGSLALGVPDTLDGLSETLLGQARATAPHRARAPGRCRLPDAGLPQPPPDPTGPGAIAIALEPLPPARQQVAIGGSAASSCVSRLWMFGRPFARSTCWFFFLLSEEEERKRSKEEMAKPPG